MSKVHISLVKVSTITANGTSMPVEDSSGVGTAELITSSGSSQASTLSITSQVGGDAPNRYAWRIANMGTDHIYCSFGAAPTAAATGKGVPAGAVCFFGCVAFADKVAVINA